jgi:hypothetical protein
MLLLNPEIIQINRELVDEIDLKSKAIFRLITFCKKTSSRKLLETFINSTNSLTELLSIKNAQMEAQSIEEVEVYHKDLKKTILFVVNEIKNQVPFESQVQLFQIFRLISPDAHLMHPNRYRDTIVQIGRYICPSPEEINSLVAQLFENLDLIAHPIIRAIYFHHELIRIHPFVDGNGRITRIAKNWILMFNLYPPIFIKDELEKKEYIQSLSDSFQALNHDNALWDQATNRFFDSELKRILYSVEYILNRLNE